MSAGSVHRSSSADHEANFEGRQEADQGAGSGSSLESPAEPAGEPKKSRRAFLVGAGVLAVAIGGGAAAVVLNNSNGKPAARNTAAVGPTATITRGDVIDTQSVDGKLTYSDQRTVPTGASGLVTWAPDVGTTITRGKPLLKVDNKPVILMYGYLPLWRKLSEGVDKGPDIRELKSNLVALGYGSDLTVDNEFTSATAQAVQDWQDAMGLKETGSVDGSQIVFQSGPVRVTAVTASVGTQIGPGHPALTVTGTARIVHVDLDAAKQGLAKQDAPVTVELPSGKQVSGHIIKVGTVAHAASSGSGSSSSGGSGSTIDVDITLSGEDTGNLDEAPVTVYMESKRSSNVLSVPVEALLALREGGFAVQVIEGATSRVVPVQTGTYGGGRVEISGSGLQEGMKVGVPAS